ncbi:translin-associated protein X-like [Papaver somniferum]|nr:translin-associated protein X-like [Papaver somniferum]
MFLNSSPFKRLLLMASKPQHLHPIAEASVLTSAKKPRTMTTVSAMKDGFANYTDYLNQFNDKRERVVKASRDITINSKKVIFQVHRISKSNREEVLEKAEKDLAAVTSQYISRLVKELQGTDFWRLRRAYSPGVQEYIEAATLCKFCKSGTLLDLAEINATLLPLSDPSLEPLQINVLDYLLGLADLTGELMRLAMGRISEGELEYAENICRFVRDIYRELTLVVPHMDENSEMKKKMEVMLQSVVKIETACFGVHVRGSEYIPSLGSTNQNYSYMGASAIDL